MSDTNDKVSTQGVNSPTSAQLDTYITEEEIPKYCNVIDGVQLSDVVIATDLINGYLGRSYMPKKFTDRVKVNRNGRGRLLHAPIIEISSVKAIMSTPFGRSKTDLENTDIELDPENDGYFTFDGNFGMTSLIYPVIPKLLEVTYTSGFKEYPSRLKTACAMLASNVRQAQSFNGAKQLTSLDFQVMMTDDSFFTSDIKLLLKGLDHNVCAL